MNKKYLKLLIDATKNPAHIVRAEAARLLGEIGDKKAVPYLVSMLQKDDWYSKVTAVYALEKIGDKRAVPVLRRIAKNPGVFDFSGFYNHDMIRLASVAALIRVNETNVLENIQDIMEVENLEAFVHFGPSIMKLPNSKETGRLKSKVSMAFLKQSAKGRFQSGAQARIAECLGYIRTKESLTMIKKYLAHFSRYVRAAAAGALLRYKNSPENRNLLKKMLKKENAVFTKIKVALLLNSSELDCILQKALLDEDYFVRATAVDAVAEAKKPEYTSALIRLLGDEHFYVRLCAVEALEKLGCREASVRVAELLKDDEIRVRLQAAKYFVNS